MDKKISQLTAKGANLASTDLLEISEVTADGYVSKHVTGSEVIASAQIGMQTALVSVTIDEQEFSTIQLFSSYLYNEQ